mmetsp:Transcript_16658/g.41232  ORF Transcript_16658/g.41232 Transcript_16658/m.41232 type:complete len:622 (+) Transcript_16658:2185-4050(+)
MKRLYAQILLHAWKNPFLRITIEALQSDWLKAFFFLLFWWTLPFYYLISVANKLVRRLRGVEDQQEWGEDDGKTFLPEPFHRHATKHCSAQLGAIYHTWNKTSVISKAYIWALAIFTLNVGCTQGLNLGLIALNNVLEGMRSWQILLIWYAAGLFAFLLPPIPGPPVYLFGGLVVVRAFEQEWSPDGQSSDDTAFWMGILITCVVALALKLNACAMQQKCIGEPLGNKPGVRAMVGVHTPSIRAIEGVLRQPGLSFGKCSILCGGPDWPTSVLCGILRVSLRQILLGTLPIFIFVAPTVMTGAFKRKTDKIYVTLTSLLFLFSVLLACAMGVAACYAIQEVIDNHGPLMTVPLSSHQELHWMDWKNAKRRKIYDKYTEWSRLPIALKIIILFGFLCMSFQCYVFFWLDSDCFGDLESVLMQTTLPAPDNRALRLYWGLSEPDWTDASQWDKVQVVKAYGQYSLAALLSGSLIYYLYTTYLKHLAAPEIAAFDKDVDTHRAEFEKEEEQRRDEIEREMVELYPEDYELYLLHTGRPALTSRADQPLLSSSRRPSRAADDTGRASSVPDKGGASTTPGGMLRGRGGVGDEDGSVQISADGGGEAAKPTTEGGDGAGAEKEKAE